MTAQDQPDEEHEREEDVDQELGERLLQAGRRGAAAAGRAVAGAISKETAQRIATWLMDHV